MFNFSGYLPLQDLLVPEAHAAEDEEPNHQLGLIAILVDQELMKDFDMRSRVLTYAENAQARIPHSKSVIIEVAKDESTFKISAMLEKLYFEGVDADLIDANPLNNDEKTEDDNQLVGVVMIGDVPLPVVHEADGTYLPSVYPYTDFYQKAYIYNHQTDQFEANPKVNSRTPEIWHGLIVPPSKDPAEAKKELLAYFDKNNDYTHDKNGYGDFEQRMLYANFPEMEKQMNRMDYGNYLRYVDFMEEMVFSRFNKHLLKEFIAQVSKDMDSSEPLWNEATIAQMTDISTEEIFKQYALSLGEALKNYRGELNKIVEKTGRWSSAEVDSPDSLITIRDEYTKTQLYRDQLVLEKKVDDFIKAAIPLPERKLDLVNLAQLQVQLTIFDTKADNRFFNFSSYIDGLAMNLVTNVNQCGIQVGEKRGKNQSVLENNSVVVNANRLYNPKTLIQPPDNPPDDWKVENTDEYKKYAGCTANNLLDNPAECIATVATQALFDIRGSMELKDNEPVYTDKERCNVERMSFFLPENLPYSTVAASGNVQNVIIIQNLEQVIEAAYTGLKGNLQNPTIKQKADFVIQTLLKKDQSFKYNPANDAIIEIKAIPQKKSIDSIYQHVQPTNETLKAIKYIGEPRVDPNTGEINFPQITTPSLPADGNRLVSFLKNGVFDFFEYVNLFKIEGNNTTETTENLLQKMTEKQSELSTKTGVKTDLFETFLTENDTLLEPLTWKTESLDQKLTQIIPKYIDRDSFMPSPAFNPQKSPENKPEGYEVLQIIANGDAQGYEFGINRAMEAQSSEQKAEQKKQEEEIKKEQEIQKQKQEDAKDKGPQLPKGNYICGDPNGVEIWEWFGAMQCWIEEEVIPKQDVFSLSNMCTAAPAPEKVAPEEENIFDELLVKAAAFKVEMKRKTLIVGQASSLTISAFNQAGDPLMGYIDMPITLTMADPSLGDFSTKEVYIFSGSREVKFTPKKSGKTEVTITMGDLPPQKFQLTVLNQINLNWVATEKKVKGQSQFEVTITAQDENKKTLTDLNDEIVLAPEKPADGGFSNNGKVTLKNGVGQSLFIPAPGKQEITLISKDPYIKSAPFVIKPTQSPASQIILKSPDSFIPIGEKAEVEVTVADEFGVPVKSFNGKIQVKLTENTKTYAKLSQTSIQIKNGKGIVPLEAGKQTADITLKASQAQLQPGSITLPLLARVDSEKWKQMYPQTLFASFVGFPAGDVTQEDYFGGVHLMTGKTEAVYSFLAAPARSPDLSIEANHLIKLTEVSQTVLADFSEDTLQLQAFDQKTKETLFSEKKALNFETAEILPKENLEKGKLYLEMLDSNYVAFKKGETFEINSKQNTPIATIQKNKVQILDNTFKWNYVPEPEFGAIELQLTDGLITPLRLILNFKPENLSEEDFSEINPKLKLQKNYGGKSMMDMSGVSFYNSTDEILEETRDEFYGLEGENKYLSLFASGTNIGEAVKYNLPTTAILLGDPTIKLKTKSNNSLNYNSATGDKIYQDAKGVQIASINHFSFNNDQHEDLAVLLEDGRVRLLEGEATEPPYKDRGDLAILADGGIALESLDLKGDGYEDLLIATKEGRLAILNNEKEEITRKDQKLKVGKQIRKLFLEDMDMDGAKDIVVLDSRGDIYIFYYDLKEKRFPEEGKLIGNYGLSLKLEENLNTDLDIRYAGIPEPQDLTDDKSNQSQVPLDQFEGGGEVNAQEAQDFYDKLKQESENLAKDPYAPSTTEIPKLPWPEGGETETYFAPIESIAALATTKKVANKDRPGEKNVDLEETLRYQIELNSAASFDQTVVADVLPDSLTLDPKTVKCVEGGCEKMEFKQNSVLLFFSNLNLLAGQKTIISYEAKISQTPEADIFVQKVNEPNENLNNPNAILDEYKDILVSPPYNNTGKLLIHYTTGPRNYSVIQSNDPKPAAPSESVAGFASIMKQMETLKNGQYDPENPPALKLPGMGDALDEATGNNDCFEDANNPNSCVEKALDDVAKKLQNLSCIGGGCFPMPFNQSFLTPPDMPLPVFAFPTTLPTAAGPMPTIWPGSFIGASNIPGPITSVMRMYVSPTLTGGIGIAACFGPYPKNTSVPPPVFPIPYPPPLGNCMVRVIPAEDLYGGLCSEIADGMNKMMNLLASGVTKIQSSINSLNNNPNVPLNVQPVGQNQAAGGLEVSLAVNLGKAMKFDPPVKTFSNIHLSSFDSIGGVIASWVDRQMLEIQNKLLTLPTVSIYLPDTKSLFTQDFEKTQKRFEGWLNTMKGSGQATLDALPQIAEQGGGSGKATYQSYLTDEVKANPIDLSQMVEKGILECATDPDYSGEGVENGFATPDCKVIEGKTDGLSDDEQRAVTGFTKKNGSWIFENGKWYFAPTDNSLTAGQAIRSGLQDVSGSRTLQFKKAIETQASIYNLNTFEGLYDVASTLPLVKLTEKPIEFKVPWLSAGAIQSYILELQNWIIYYEQEYDRVKDKWEALKCDDQPDPNQPDDYAENAINCTGRKLADAFGANFDENIESAKQNIAVLQSYLAFPKDLAAYKVQLAGYVGSVSCYLDVIANMMGGYMATIKQQMIKWAETILTIREIVKNIKELFNVFTNFENNCETCTNERFGNFGWWSLLGLVLPDIPVIQFPKIPDIVLDLSNMDIMLDIELPVLNIRPEPIPLPPLPYITLPDFPNASVFLQLPPLPILPALPKLPPLPDLPPLPVIDLPTLPPPPKLPDVGKAFEVIMPLIEKILQTWCMMKKSLAPVPEMMVGDQIRLLTTRPAYLTPIDLLQLQAPKIALFDLGFNQIRIQTVIYLGLNIKIDQPLEELTKTWNGWVEDIPKAMNQAYQTYLEATEGQVQGALDSADSFMKGAAQTFEDSFDKYVQGWLDKQVGDPMAEADKWLKDKQGEWQKWADKQGVKISYEAYYQKINELYETVRQLKNSKVNEWFDENHEIIQGLNYLMPGVKVFEVLSDDKFKEYQQEMLDLTAEKLSQLSAYGPTLLPRLYACLRYYEDCRAAQDKYFGGPNIGLTDEEIKSLVPDIELPKPQASLPALKPTSNAGLVEASSEEKYAKELLGTPEGKQIASLFGEIGKTIEEVNNAQMVDYTVLKEKFGVPDYELAPRPTTVDKLKEMGKELTANSEKLYAEAEGLKNAQDMIALFGPAPEKPEAFVLATSQGDEGQTEPRVMTSALDPPKLLAKNDIQPLDDQLLDLQEKINKEYKENQPINPVEDTTGCKADLCLPDPITHKPVPVIPSIELLPQSETLFMPNGHLVYSDGTGLYLKKDLTINDSDQNTDTGTPQRFSLEEIMGKLKIEPEPKEAVNMLESQFTQNGAATFNWLTPNNPTLYGYGLELKKKITGFDVNKIPGESAEVKVVLLPPDEKGNAPEVFSGNQKIKYGTLISTLKTSEEAQKRFGIKADNFVSGASEIHFPSINNAQINVSDYKAVYFDQLQGSGESLQMENGFYYLKMTWFDAKAKSATYSENEILAPQITANDSGPLLINQADKYLVPIYKEKKIKAHEIFSDLSGSYQYYWQIGEQKELQKGNQLNIAPQKSLKKLKVKLIASQDIEDPGAERFEKEFTIEIYAPAINLDQAQLDKGVIAGQMSPAKDQADDLEGIPFTVFRNRDGAWKNLGILHAQDETKSPTNPPLNDHEDKKYKYENSYYGIGTEGNYEIQGFDLLDPSPLVIKDNQGKKIAEVMPGNGLIKLLDDKYILKAMPATTNLPTRITILLKQTSEVIANIYFIADATKKITLVKTELVYPNVAKEGVTVGDVDEKDKITVEQIPENAPSFPGGAAIVDQDKEKNIALIDKDGAIRIMEDGYELELKKKVVEENPYIFELVDKNGTKPLADIFIQANWNHLEVDQKTNMPALEKNTAEEKNSENEKNKTPLLPGQSQIKDNLGPLLPGNSIPSNPFSDVPANHPYYKQIMELYSSDVVRGFEDKTFKPDQPLTRAEFIKIALGVTNCFDCQKATEPQIARYLTNPFPDVNLSLWSFYCIWVAKELKMITGYGDGQYRPSQNISRAEAAAILLRQSDIKITSSNKQFKDVLNSAWYRGYVQKAVELGLIKESNGMVKPDQAITRGEFAFMASALKNYKQCRLVDEDGDGNFDWWEMTHNLDPLRKDADKSCACTNNPNQNDTDKDGLKDVCDLDIDNDGTLNPMCIFDEKGNFSQTLLDSKEGDLGTKEKVDNCIFTSNVDQADYDNNGVGDVCEVCPCSNNPNKTDTDKDGIKDICDADIDNDKLNNPICIFDETGLLDEKKALGSGDNCLFVNNPGQEDLNKNGIGDACETGDLCPNLPEDMDGINDEDGCPELDDKFGQKDAGAYVSPGPLCGLIDYKSDFMPGDIFMTAITDVESHQTLFSKSKELNYK